MRFPLCFAAVRRLSSMPARCSSVDCVWPCYSCHRLLLTGAAYNMRSWSFGAGCIADTCSQHSLPGAGEHRADSLTSASLAKISITQ